ncbi:hypothetical protein BOSP111201_26450 [Bordetella sputigena]|uniref:Bug family tripartite tricarboxylate transporter substrate binding protein n=1 Tax=Bordetella sputigena TaxID=1416810 RepID=UPI0039EE65AA
MMKRIVLIFFLALVAHAAGAEESFPTKPIRLIVPFGSGGPVDNISRVVAAKAAEKLGNAIVVENRPGAGGNVGTVVVKQANADGYTLLVAGVSFVVNPFLYANAGYDAVKDFVPIRVIAQYPQVMAVSPRVPVRDVKQLIALSKEKPNEINYGSAGIGTSGHLIMASFIAQSGAKMTHVPYKGGSTTLLGLLRGDVDVAVDGLPSFMDSAGLDNRVRIMGVSTAKPWPLAPTLPSIAQTAGLPDFDFSSWVMFLAPKGTPANVVGRLAKAVDDSLSDPAVKERLKAMASLPVGTSVDTNQFLRDESEKWGKIVRQSGAKVD